jgi:hypothetical protein
MFTVLPKCPNIVIKTVKKFSICHRCSKKFEMALMGYSGVLGVLIHQKNLQSHGTVPLMCVSGTDLPSRKAGSVSALGLTLSALYTPAFFSQIRKKLR